MVRGAAREPGQLSWASAAHHFRFQSDLAFADTSYSRTGKSAAFARGTVATGRIPIASTALDGSHRQMRPTDTAHPR